MDYIIISHVTSLPSDVVDEIESSLIDLNVPVSREQRRPIEFVAGVEWLLVTAAVLYFGKPYFEAFLSEAGKHHYDILRRAAGKCWESFFGENRKYEQQLIDSRGQVRPQRYSLTFSVMSETSEGSIVKLLIEESITREEIGEAVLLFLCEMAQHHLHGTSDSIDTMVNAGPPLGSKYLVTADLKKKKLIVVDIVPSHVRERAKT
jgi:hypothetical protein